MKKIFLLIALFISSGVIAQKSIEQLQKERDNLYQIYIELTQSDKKTTLKQSEKMVSALKDMVIKDTEIITKCIASDKKLKESTDQVDSLKTNVKTLNTEIDSVHKYSIIIEIAGIALGVIVIMLLVITFTIAARHRKLKTKLLVSDQSEVILLKARNQELEDKLQKLDIGQNSVESLRNEKAITQTEIVEKLHYLKSIGGITQEEFDIYKQNFLSNL